MYPFPTNYSVLKREPKNKKGKRVLLGKLGTQSEASSGRFRRPAAVVKLAAYRATQRPQPQSSKAQRI